MITAIVIQSLCDLNNGVNHFPGNLSPEVNLVAHVHSVTEGIEAVRKARPNLVILDVDMPGDSAFRVFEETSDVQYEKIILSEQPRHAIKAARYKVADYLLKPLREEDLWGAVDRLLFSRGQMMIQQLYKDVCCKRKQLKLEKIFLHRVDQSMVMLRVSSIRRIEDMGSYREVVTLKNDLIPITKSLSKLSHMLVYNDFFLVNDHLLRLDHVQALEESRDSLTVIMDDGLLVPIPLSREHNLRRRLNLPGKGPSFE